MAKKESQAWTPEVVTGGVTDLPGADEAGLTPPTKRGGTGRTVTEVLIELGFCSREQVESMIAKSRNTGEPPERLLVQSGHLTPHQFTRALAERFGIDHLDLTQFKVDLGAAGLVSADAARRYKAVPVKQWDEKTLLVAMADPANVLAVDDLAIITGHDVKPAVASWEDIEDVINRYSSRLDEAVAEAAEDEEEEEEEVSSVRESAEDAPVIKLVNSIIRQAIEEGATDIHFEPQETDMTVRFRVDGVLQEVTTVPKRLVLGVTSRLKIMCEMDIAERRLPQDGRISMKVKEHHVDIRGITLPSARGENVVMRLLDTEQVVLELEALGFQDQSIDRFRAAFGRAHGATLVTGPTGSGKTTTLYAALGAINTPEKNIITVEDPVEYQLSGITQMQINQRAGLNFATALRSMLRADPDIIMVGEVRDRETAQIAVESALTGHLVLTTLHTNDAPTSITRLIEMEVEPFLTASAVECIVAQRLARRLCENCAEDMEISAETLRKSGIELPGGEKTVALKEPGGCRRCSNTGYRGRIGVFEVMTMSDEIRTLTIERGSTDKIRDVAREQGMVTLREDGLEKVRQGVTSIAELLRVTS